MADLNGKILLQAKYDGFKQEYQGISFFKSGDKWQIWDYEKRKLLPVKYDEVMRTERKIEFVIAFERVHPRINKESVAIVKKNGKWGLVNKNGKLIEDFGTDLGKLYKYKH